MAPGAQPSDFDKCTLKGCHLCPLSSRAIAAKLKRPKLTVALILRKAGNPLRAVGTARHGPNDLNGKQLRVIHYVPRRALPCRQLVMGYSQLLSIKTIRAVPCRDVPRRAGSS